MPLPKLRTITMLLLLICPVSAQDNPDLPDITHVIVISIDGARPDAILQAQTPTMHTLAETGAVDWEAQTVMPPATIPAHTSLLTGIDVDEHKVRHNNYTTERIEPVTFIDRAQDAGYQTAIVAGKEKFLTFHTHEDTYYEFVRTGDPGVTDKTIELLEAGYEVLLVHMPNTDYFGHLTGWMSDVYIYELRNTDTNIRRILDALDTLGIRDSTLLIITADHGGHDTSHGSSIPEDMTIPMIVHAPGIEPETILSDTSITQVASTVLLALGLEPAPAMEDPLLVLTQSG